MTAFRSPYGDMRFRAAHQGSGLADLMLRALTTGHAYDIDMIRALSFEAFENALDSSLPPEFRAAAPLPERSQVVIDSAVIGVGRQRLQFVAELINEGLIYNLPNALSVPFLETEMIGNVGAAIRVMNPEARGEDQLPTMLPSRIPIYITKDQWSLDIRTLGQSRRVGLPLDTTLLQQKTRAVNEAIEDAGVNGATTLDGGVLVVGGYSAPGLVNAPNANQQVLTASAWTGTTPNGGIVMAEINTMMAKLIADFKRGPYTLFVPPGVDQAFNLDFKANGNDSVRARLSQMSAGGRPLKIVLVDTLPANKVALVQMTSDVVDLIDGIRPTAIPYTSPTGMTFHSMIMAIMIPRFRTDIDGNSGVVIGTISGSTELLVQDVTIRGQLESRGSALPSSPTAGDSRLGGKDLAKENERLAKEHDARLAKEAKEVEDSKKRSS